MMTEMLARQGISDANLVEALWAVDIGLVGGRVCGGVGGGLAGADAEGSGATKKRAHSRRSSIYAGSQSEISLSSIA